MTTGRFTVACLDGFAVLVDTATGRSWACPVNASGRDRREWQPIRFAETGQVTPPEMMAAERREGPPAPVPARRATGTKAIDKRSRPPPAGPCNHRPDLPVKGSNHRRRKRA
jgi:hypothetical protein